MPERVLYQGRSFPMPSEGLSKDEATRFIFDGIRTETESTSDIVAWLDHCVKVFANEPYSGEIVVACQALVNLARESSIEGIEPGSEAPGVDELCQTCFECVAQGDIDAADTAIAEAVEKASEIAKRWKDEPQTTLCFNSPMEMTIYALIQDNNDPFSWEEPNIAHAFYMRGVLDYEMGKFDDAERYCLRSLEFNPVNAMALLEAAEAAKQLGHWEDVLRYAQAARKIAWKTYDVSQCHRTMSFALSEMGQYELACAHIVLAEDYYPTELGEREMVWLKHKGVDTASMSLDRALELVGEENMDRIVSEPVAYAADQLLQNIAKREPQGEDDPYLQIQQDILHEVMLWNRKTRNAYYGREDE